MIIITNVRYPQKIYNNKNCNNFHNNLDAKNWLVFNASEDMATR